MSHCIDTYDRIAERGDPAEGKAVIEKLYKEGDIPEHLYMLAMHNISIEEARYNRESKLKRVLIQITLSDLRRRQL